MRGPRYFSGVVVALSCACVLTYSVAFSEISPDPQIARTDISAAAISWTPLTDFKTAVLTVSGPGDLFMRREFAAGEAIRLEVISKSVGALEDGQYEWELQFTPQLAPDVELAIHKARETGDQSVIDTLKEQGKIPEGGVASGFFRVMDGSIVGEDARELAVVSGGGQPDPSASTGIVDADSPIATKDQVINDDLIVLGSACIGFDCVNGESFGFDTLRLKENNLRIRAFDTSSSASFPTNDWQITFNDSANGGANKFSIDDIDGGRTPFTIMAGARSNALFVSSSSRVGFGTSTPVVDLHVVNGNTPTLRLEQNGSSGFTPQTWDVAGNETNFFIRDVTGGSRLPIRIRPGAPTSSIDIATSGNVGLGTSSPAAKLHLLASSAQTALFEDTSVTGAKWYVGNSGDSTFKISADGTGAVEAKFDRSGNLTIRGDLFKAGNGTPYTFPDYVFSDGYSLLTLDELEAFIEENHHLPGVMSVAEVEASGGVNITKLQMQVLEKIEELTLYLIEQRETIRRLEAELASLRAGQLAGE